ncbi:MAG: 50S ribosomal protein L31e [Promethearchaeota archaeon]
MSREERITGPTETTPAEVEDVVVERLYTIPLGKVYETVRGRRAKRAVKMVRAFIARHMKPEEEEDLIIDPTLNEYLWARGIEKPPRRVRVRTTKDKEGIVRVYLVEGQ